MMKKQYDSSFEQEVFEKLDSKKDLYAPLEIEEVQVEPLNINLNGTITQQRYKPDALIKIKYLDRIITLLIEIKGRTAPKIVEQGIIQLENYRWMIPNNPQYNMTLLVPYLSKEIIKMLDDHRISGLDLNGNYYVKTQDFVAIRLDRINRYKESNNIKNIYSGKSSIVGRYLLKRNSIYNSVNEIYNGIKSLGGDIALSTVSKVLTRLEEDLVIQKDENTISVLQPEKLLANLKENYKKPKVTKRIKLNIPGTRQQAADIFESTIGNNWIWSGESSAEYYAPTTRDKEFIIYAKSYNSTNQLKNYTDDKFYNCILELIPKSQDYVFFDSINNMASKIQTYLELSNLDKREKEIAEDLKMEILNEFN